jgi:hypothetical protein
MAVATCGEGRSERRQSGECDGEAMTTAMAHSSEGRKEVTTSRAPTPMTEREEGGATLGGDLRGKRGGGEWPAEVV